VAKKPKDAEIPGWYDLEQIARGIMGREATGKVFADSAVVDEDTPSDAVKSPKCNRVQFTYHPTSHYPSRCVVLAAGAAAPAGHAREWSGAMVVEAVETDVVLYRQS
jgi:hypothetical protein